MQNGPLKDLKDEHEGITLMLDIMKKVASRLKNKEEVKAEHLEKITEFLSNFADKCHHGKEEGILFPEAVKDVSNLTMINELLGEHKTGRDYIRGIKESQTGYETGNPDAYHIAVNMEGYIMLLSEHIRKENEKLFPAIEKQIPDGTQLLIKEKFDALERDVIGEGKHEEYHGWLRDLKRHYLNLN
ncbi:MAG: hemerythrin HHE cation-binding protein [Actinobacteria bacterium]|nr:hemerythrin HHE cation-binding protein [Actinomycetota bacterium]